MRTSRLWILCALIALSGCVNGRGCLLLQPVKHTLAGHVHFRSYPAADGIDKVPILALDQTAYVYAPAHSYQCIPVTELQLVGVSEFPGNIIENSHVSARGSLFEATSERQHTRFLVNVTTLLPLAPTP
ncbi:MAG: hypothetical protein M3O41_08990 [Pseudomonadota bacterium]|nr:hypothetical protein [Pseudomonadota bacterium]